MQKNSTPLLVVAAALIGGDGRVLLQRRRPGAEHGGLWEFPGGKVEPGESPAYALVREIDEELGLRIEPSTLRPLMFASDDGTRLGTAGAGAPRSLVILLYTCRSWQGHAECRDGQAIGWFDPEEFPGLPMPPLDYPLAEAVARSI